MKKLNVKWTPTRSTSSLIDDQIKADVNGNFATIYGTQLVFVDRNNKTIELCDVKDTKAETYNLVPSKVVQTIDATDDTVKQMVELAKAQNIIMAWQV